MVPNLHHKQNIALTFRIYQMHVGKMQEGLEFNSSASEVHCQANHFAQYQKQMQHIDDTSSKACQGLCYEYRHLRYVCTDHLRGCAVFTRAM